MSKKIWIEFDRCLNEGEEEQVTNTLGEFLTEVESHGYDEFDGLQRFSGLCSENLRFGDILNKINCEETGLVIVDIYTARVSYA